MESSGWRLKKYREHLLIEAPELSKSTGIPEDRITGIESGLIRPTEHEGILLTGFFRCGCGLPGPYPGSHPGYERYTAFDEAVEFFEKYGAGLSRQDRWSVHVFLCLCGHEAFIYRDLLGFAVKIFPRRSPGDNPFEEGRRAGAELRAHLGWGRTETPAGLDAEFMRVGFHAIFRKLENPDVAGICIRRDDGALYLLVNYDGDYLSRRFTLARLVAHAVFGLKNPVLRPVCDLSNPGDLRSAAFAAGLLFAPELLTAGDVSRENVVETAMRLRVTVRDLTLALMASGAIDPAEAEKLRAWELTEADRTDPLLKGDITGAAAKLRLHLLQRGLSPAYIELCLSALNMKLLNPGCLALMLLTNERELPMILDAFDLSIG